MNAPSDAVPSRTQVKPKGRLRHIALNVPDPWQAAEFYMNAFGMEKVGESESSLAVGIYLTDGIMNLALLHYKTDEAAGTDRGKGFVGIHHMGFWVDDLEATRAAVESAGGCWWMGEPANAGNAFYEVKYRDPNRIVIDLTETGWGGASKDPTPQGSAPGLRHANMVADRSVIAKG